MCPIKSDVIRQPFTAQIVQGKKDFAISTMSKNTAEAVG
jgi:hypothetical protein